MSLRWVVKKGLELGIEALDRCDDGAASGTTTPAAAAGPVAGGDPQVPIDALEISWTEIITPAGEVIAYLLTAGSKITTTTFTTSKGTVRVTPGSEQWFSPTVSELQTNVTGVAELLWRPYVVNTTQGTAISDLAAKIDTAKGLKDLAGRLDPDVVGPSGAVLWRREPLPGGLTSFSMTWINGTVWTLSRRQNAAYQLTGIFWSPDTTDPPRSTRPATLPWAFHGDVTLKKDLAPPVVYIFRDYSYRFTA